MLQDSIARAKQSVKARYWPPIVRAVRDEELTSLDGDALNDLFRRVTQLDADANEGILIEVGCDLGGSSIVMAQAKSKSRLLYLYDLFDSRLLSTTLDSSSDLRSPANAAGTASLRFPNTAYDPLDANLLGIIADNFSHFGLKLREHNIHFVKGLLQDTIRVTVPVALAHISGDGYDRIMTCLTRIEPHLIPGGVLVIDSYDDDTGCRKAVQDYFVDKAAHYNFVRESRLHILKR